MYSELDVHTEDVCDVLMKHLSTEDNPAKLTYILSPARVHPTSTIVATNHDGRKFKVTVTTEELVEDL